MSMQHCGFYVIMGLVVSLAVTLHAGEGKAGAGLSHSVKQKLGQTKVPEVNFRQAHIRDVVHFLSEASRNHDPKKVGVNMIWSGDAAALKKMRPMGKKDGGTGKKDGVDASGVPLITFRARHISVLEALNIVTQIAGLKYRIEGNIVLVMPKNAPDDTIRVRTYNVKPTIGDRIQKLRKETGLRRTNE